MKKSLITVEQLEKKSEELGIPFANLAAGCGIRKILHLIAASELNEWLWFRSHRVLEEDYLKKMIPERMVFFPAKEDRQALKTQLRELVRESEQEELPEGLHLILEEEERKLPIVVGHNLELHLEIVTGQYRIPMRVDIEPYHELTVYPRKEPLQEFFPQKKEIFFCMFPLEEYLAEGYYHILDRLELLSDLSWYKEIYDILTEEPIEGRKMRDSLARVLEEKPLPSLEKRLDTLKSYETYSYMNKKWKKEKKRYPQGSPEWGETVRLLTAFLEPVFEAIQRDEIFFGDWMPQLGRYL